MTFQILRLCVIVLIFSSCFLGFNYAVAGTTDSAPSCEIKAETQDVGHLSVDVIDEASGLALTPDGQHFFVTNDSGDLPRFFRTKLDGSNVEEFRLFDKEKDKEWKPFDVEELSVGPCPRGLAGQCVVIADIGDNRDRRKNVELAFVRLDELPAAGGAATLGKKFKGKTVDAMIAKKIKFTYPDGPRNAEAFSVLNSRYGLIVSKEQDRKVHATKPAGVYIVDFETAQVARVGEWDVPTWVKDQGLSALVTGLSVVTSATGKAQLRVLLLTYRDVIELIVSTDIMTSTTWPPRPWSVVSRTVFKVDPLEQQEAIAFDRTHTGFYYTSESPLAMLGFLGKDAPIRWVKDMKDAMCR